MRSHFPKRLPTYQRMGEARDALWALDSRPFFQVFQGKTATSLPFEVRKTSSSLALMDNRRSTRIFVCRNKPGQKKTEALAIEWEATRKRHRETESSRKCNKDGRNFPWRTSFPEDGNTKIEKVEGE